MRGWRVRDDRVDTNRQVASRRGDEDADAKLSKGQHERDHPCCRHTEPDLRDRTIRASVRSHPAPLTAAASSCETGTYRALAARISAAMGRNLARYARRNIASVPTRSQSVRAGSKANQGNANDRARHREQDHNSDVDVSRDGGRLAPARNQARWQPRRPRSPRRYRA